MRKLLLGGMVVGVWVGQVVYAQEIPRPAQANPTGSVVVPQAVPSGAVSPATARARVADVAPSNPVRQPFVAAPVAAAVPLFALSSPSVGVVPPVTVPVGVADTIGAPVPPVSDATVRPDASDHVSSPVSAPSNTPGRPSVALLAVDAAPPLALSSPSAGVVPQEVVPSVVAGTTEVLVPPVSLSALRAGSTDFVALSLPAPSNVAEDVPVQATGLAEPLGVATVSPHTTLAYTHHAPAPIVSSGAHQPLVSDGLVVPSMPGKRAVLSRAVVPDVAATRAGLEAPAREALTWDGRVNPGMVSPSN
jgi:hypothetical protein